MQSISSARVSKVSLATSIFLLLLAMMLPVCHMHPLLDKSSPDHCAICLLLHATPPLGVHAPPALRLFEAGKVLASSVSEESFAISRSFSTRAPPLPGC